MQMSMADAPESGASEESMDVDDKDQDYSEVRFAAPCFHVNKLAIGLD